jgi:hypothetical protein
VCLNDGAPRLDRVFHGGRTVACEVVSLPHGPYLDGWVRDQRRRAGDEVCGLRCVVPSPHRLVVAYSVVMAQCGGA